MNGMKRFFTAKSSSRSYAFAYLGCIPAFALVYTIISADFYHSTAIHEKSVASDLKAIQAGIEQTLNNHIARQYGRTQAVSNGWTLKGNEVAIAPLAFKDGIYSCNLVMVLERRKNDAPERLSGTLATMSFNLSSTPSIKDNVKCKFVAKQITFSVDGFTEFNPYLLLAKPPAGFTGPPPEVRFLSIPIQLERQIVAYSEAANGFPAHSSGTFWRMLYLSAVTITTLGYGDILPVTDKARIAISLEAVLGIVIIGYYLASLATPVNDRGGTISS